MVLSPLALDLAFSLWQIHAEALIRAGWSVEAYKTALQTLHPLRALALPGNLVDPLTSLLALDPKGRLEAADFLTSESPSLFPPSLLPSFAHTSPLCWSSTPLSCYSNTHLALLLS